MRLPLLGAMFLQELEHFTTASNNIIIKLTSVMSIGEASWKTAFKISKFAHAFSVPLGNCIAARKEGCVFFKQLCTFLHKHFFAVPLENCSASVKVLFSWQKEKKKEILHLLTLISQFLVTWQESS